MCRNIKTLFNFEPPATEREIRDASLQFVRKLTGFNTPSKANKAAFDHAVEEVAHVARHLFEHLETNAQLEVTPDYTRNEYREKVEGHLDDLRERTQAAGMGYFRLMTDRPLDEALREYLTLRGGRN